MLERPTVEVQYKVISISLSEITKTAHKKIADFLLQLQESNPTADLEELVMVEESLNSINRQLTEFIEVSHNHCHSERQNMESMRMQWQQTLNFSTKSSS